MSTEWMAERRCSDVPTSVFFPDDGGSVQGARRVCQRCEVRAACLEYALAARIDDGVWGGATPRERQQILRERFFAQHDRRGPLALDVP
jgi:WhiB family redox-sensing transcriptional regulator